MPIHKRHVAQTSVSIWVYTHALSQDLLAAPWGLHVLSRSSHRPHSTARARVPSAEEAARAEKGLCLPLGPPHLYLQPERSRKVSCKLLSSLCVIPRLSPHPLCRGDTHSTGVPRDMPASRERRPPALSQEREGGGSGPLPCCSHAQLPHAWSGNCSQSLLGAVTFPGWNRKPPDPDRK